MDWIGQNGPNILNWTEVAEFVPIDKMNPMDWIKSPMQLIENSNVEPYLVTCHCNQKSQWCLSKWHLYCFHQSIGRFFGVRWKTFKTTIRVLFSFLLLLCYKNWLLSSGANSITKILWIYNIPPTMPTRFCKHSKEYDNCKVKINI